jgi:hypothetical protein
MSKIRNHKRTTPRVTKPNPMKGQVGIVQKVRAAKKIESHQDQCDQGPGGGSRDIQWGWAPVGGASFFDVALTPNDLVAIGFIGTVTVSVT